MRLLAKAFAICWLLVHAISVHAIVWDGGGADNKWSTPENWIGDQLPTSGDAIIFDGTSTKTCVIDLPDLQVASVTVTAAFTGTIEWPSFQYFLVDGNVNIGGGTMTGMPFYRIIGGDFVRTGGDVSSFQPALSFDQYGGHRLVPGPGGLDAFSLVFRSQTTLGAGTFDLQGDVRTVYLETVGVASVLGEVHLTTGAITIAPEVPGLNLIRVSAGTRLVLEDGTLIDGTRIESLDNAGQIVQLGSGRLHVPARAIAFTNASGGVVSTIGNGGSIYITLFDDDEDTSGGVADTTTVVVTSPVTGDSENLVLTETGPSTGVFRNASGLPALFGAANPADGVLQFGSGENLRVEYSDPQDPGDTIGRDLAVPDIVWDGGGGDENWSTPANWSGDALPGYYDNVRFDGASTKTVYLDTDFAVQDLTITTPYTGTLYLQSGGDRNVRGNFLMQGGTLNWFIGLLQFYRDVTFDGGTVDSTYGSISFLGNTLQVLTTPPGGFDIYQIAAAGGDNQVVRLAGPMSLGAYLNVGSPGTPAMLEITGGTVTVGGASTSQCYVFAGSTLQVDDGAVLDLSGVTQLTNTSRLVELGSGYIHRPASALGFTDAAGDPLTTHTVGGDLHVTLVDGDENTSGTAPDATSVIVRSLTTGDEVTLELIETGAATGMFRNAAPLATASGAANLGDNILQETAGETVQVTYVDPRDPGDTLSRNLGGGTVVWDGGGTTNDWTDPLNWDTDEAPTIFDSVVFDGTSSKTCQLGTNGLGVKSLTLATSFSGTLHMDNFVASFNLSGDLMLLGGLLDASNVAFGVGGDTVLTSGTAIMQGLRIDITRTTQTLSIGPAGFQLRVVEVRVLHDGGTLDIVGDLRTAYFSANTSGSPAGRVRLTSGSVTILSGPSSNWTLGYNVEFVIGDGTFVDARAAVSYYGFGRLVQVGSGRMRRNSTSLNLTDAGGAAQTQVGAGGGVYVTLADDDENIAGLAQDVTHVTVASQASGDMETVTLTETSSASGLFRSLLGLPTAFGSAAGGDGVLQVGQGDQLRAFYTDPQDSADTRMSPLVPVVEAGALLLHGATPLVDGSGVLDLGDLEVGGTSVPLSLTLLNPGGYALQVSGLAVPEGFVVTQPPPATVAAGSSATLGLAFTAGDTIGHYGGALSFVNNTFANNPYTIQLRAHVRIAALTGPLGEIVNYLLGIASDDTGLDANGDAVVDIGDLVTRIDEQTPTTPTLRLPIDGTSGLSPTPTPR